MTNIQQVKFKNPNGFTLIEVLVAIFILSIGVLTIFGIFPLGIQIARSSEMATIAVYLGETKIEEVISTPYEEIFVGATTDSSLPPPFSSYGRETRVTYVDPALGLQEVANDTEVKKIEVTVSWKSPVGLTEKSIELVTLIGKR